MSPGWMPAVIPRRVAWAIHLLYRGESFPIQDELLGAAARTVLDHHQGLIRVPGFLPGIHMSHVRTPPPGWTPPQRDGFTRVSGNPSDCSPKDRIRHRNKVCGLSDLGLGIEGGVRDHVPESGVGCGRACRGHRKEKQEQKKSHGGSVAPGTRQSNPLDPIISYTYNISDVPMRWP